MAKFIGRQRELAELDEIVTWRPSQFILVYGRRRVGKTTLVLHWAKSTGRPVLYWVAARDTPAQVRQGFVQAVWSWAHSGELEAPCYNNWST